MPPGEIRLNNTTVNGYLKVIYAAASDESLAPSEGFGIDPVLRRLQANERFVNPVALQQALETFDELYRLSRNDLWQRLTVATRYSLETLTIPAANHYLFRRENSGIALSYPNTEIINQSDRPMVVLRPSDGLVCLYNTGVDEAGLWQSQAEVVLSPNTSIVVEAEMSIPGIALLAGITNDQVRWEAPLLCSGAATPATQSIGAADFLQWSEQTQWQPELDVQSETGDTGTAIITRQILRVGDQNRLVLQMDLASNIDFARCRVLGQFDTSPAPIHYALSGATLLLRLQDGAGWYWERTLPATNGQFATLPLRWNQFSFSALQINSGQPIGPDTTRPIQLYQIIGQPEPSTFTLYYIGEPPRRLDYDSILSRCGVVSRLGTPHTLKVGDVYLLPLTTRPYTPGVMPETLHRLGEAEASDGLMDPMANHQIPLAWDQLNLNSRFDRVYQFWQDAQNAYFVRTGIQGPFDLRLAWDANQFKVQGGRDHGLRQAETALLAAQGWQRRPGHEPAASVVMNWLRFLHDQWGAGPAFGFTRFPATATPISDRIAPEIVAIYAQTALLANLAGGDRRITFQVLQKSLDYLHEHCNFELAHEPTPGSGLLTTQVLAAFSLTVLHQAQIRYPLPSEMGDTTSDYARKLVRVRQFFEPLNLPRRACAGFRFNLPLQVES